MATSMPSTRSPVPLFHDAQLHQHGPPPRLQTGEGDGDVSSISRSHRQGSAGAGVVDQPELRQGSGDAGTSSITRSTTFLGAPGRNRTCDTRFRKTIAPLAGSEHVLPPTLTLSATGLQFLPSGRWSFRTVWVPGRREERGCAVARSWSSGGPFG